MEDDRTPSTPAYHDCLRLYIASRGRRITDIEREMRRLGHARFHRRILYTRTENGIRKPGWIERYGWQHFLSVPPASAGGFLPAPSQAPLLDRRGGGEADGVVDQSAPLLDRRGGSEADGVVDHSAPLLDRRGGGRADGVVDHSAPLPDRRGGSEADGVVDQTTPLLDRRGGGRADGVVDQTTPLLDRRGGSEADGVVEDLSPAAPPSFRAWLRRVSPNMTWDWHHQQIIIDALEKITTGRSKRLMIFVPPRHGKSELVTVRYSAWRLTQRPEMSVILAGHTQQLANRFSRKIQNVIIDSEALRLRKSVPPASAGGFLPVPTLSEPPQVSGGSQAQGSKNNICVHQRSSAVEDPASPFPFSRPRRKNSVSEWETATGGTFRAVGIGGGITGYGADLIVIDDPIKSRAEAESPAFRKRLYHWFNDDLYTRLEPDGAVILIQTRWHEDDLAGRLIREMHDGGEHWDVVSLPAISQAPLLDRRGGGEAGGVVDQTTLLTDRRGGGVADGVVDKSTPLPALSAPPEASKLRNADRGLRISSSEENIENNRIFAGGTRTDITDPISKTENVPATNSAFRIPKSAIENSAFRIPHSLALCPERFDLEALDKIKRKLGSYSFSALYQQRPTPAEGGIFKRKWFGRIVDSPPPGLRWARGYDLAVSTNTSACFTASFRCAFAKNGDLYIADGFRGRIEYPDQRRYIIGRLTSEPDTQHGIEKAIHGHGIVQDIRREPGARGYLLRGIKVETDKVTRALAWSPLAEDGKVVLVRGPWINEFIDEVAAFPAGEHDDQVDAVSLAVGMLRGPSKKAYAF
ncbi:MAG TPA: phage terminase large subunit [Pyrinomonadaceae bacterium]|nr:phage terminase large subunit [Pyrinomonadaceae bacterium]HMP66231.1 phage terminase large subunit [Pyrinomonadaceae bacterium]